MKRKVVGLTLSTLLLLIALGVTSIIATSAPDWSSLNQIMDTSGDKVFFRWSPQSGVYCAAVTIMTACDVQYDGNFWAQLETWTVTDCSTLPNPGLGELWYKAGDTFLTSSWAGGRIYNGDQIVPKLVMNWICDVQALDNTGTKKNIWPMWLPMQMRAYP